MKKFIKGTFELDKDVADLETYEENKKEKLLAIVDWCTRFGVSIHCGTADDHTYLCEYKIVANTKAMCNGLLTELRALLKDCFPYVSSIFQGSGDCF